MKSNALLLAAALIVSASAAHARQAPSTSPPTTASAEVRQCAQSQMVVDRLLSTANTRLEAARQTNSARDMRAAVDELQATLRDVRAQLAPCANVQPATDAHAGHAMPNVQQPAAATPGTPAVAPAAKPPAGAVDPHAGHAMPAAPAKPAPGAKPTPGAKAPAAPAVDHSKMDMGTSAKPAPDASAQATDPVCGLKVDPSTAPSTKHQRQTYYFCSPQHQQLFQKNPAKFLPKRP